MNQSFLLEVDEELTQCLSPSSNSQNLHKAITFPSISADILVQFVWENSTSFNPSISPLPMAFTYASFRLQYLQNQVHPWLSSRPFFGSKNHFTSTKNSTSLALGRYKYHQIRHYLILIYNLKNFRDHLSCALHYIAKILR